MTTPSRSRKVSKAWLHDHINDPYVKLAQREGYRARAAYKLQEIDETLHLLKPGQVVVDLGAAPGAWSQYVQRRFAMGKPPGGTVIALDLLPLEPIEGVTLLQGDFREDAVLAQLEEAIGSRAVDVVLSDMAPNLSGIPASDAARMADLVELAVDFAGRHLVPRGALVAKVFHGSGYSQLVERFKATFRTVKPFKPKASRDRSAETFLVGIGLKAPASASDIRT
jgi:23S rRNA (uridine2552-2'-O)-methyltransferase